MADDDAGPSRNIKMEDAPVGGVEGRLPDGSGKPMYKSWKKKYRKMRIVFDQEMHIGEELYKQEQKAFETTNRLAVEIDRLLDLLLDVNNSAQMPQDKRFDLALDPPADVPGAVLLEIDDPSKPKPGDPKPGKSLRDLVTSVGHLDYAAAAARSPNLIVDLQGGIDSPAADAARAGHPPSFLTADDIDNYLWETDRRIAAQRRHEGRASSEPPVPTLAPHALAAAGGANGVANGLPHGGGHHHHHHHHHGKDGGPGAGRDFALRNPTSVYNWLRKHEPKVFLQDGEGGDKGGGENGEDGGHHGTGRGRRGGGGERGGGRGAGGGAGSRSSKRASAAHARDRVHSVVDHDGGELDDDTTAGGGGGGHEGGRGAGAGGGASKRKRPVDDDPGYRPKGGSSRPAKKKRKSEGGGGDSTPTAATHRRPRKSDAGAAHAAPAGEAGEAGGRED